MKTNRISIKLFLFTFFFLSLVFNNPLEAVTNITVYYGAPKDTMVNHGASAVPISYSNGTKVILPGFRWLKVEGNNVAVFNRMATPNMKKTYQILKGTNTANTKLKEILKIANATIDLEIYLVDDRQGITNAQDDGFLATTPINKQINMIWPAAGISGKKSPYYASVCLGELSCRLIIKQAGGFKAWESTILHEASHSQVLPDPKRGYNKWDTDANGRITGKGVLIAYGADNEHSGNEILGSRQSALDEGIGNFWGVEHNPDEAKKSVKFLNNEGHRFFIGSWSLPSSWPKAWGAPNHKEKVYTTKNIPLEYKTTAANQGKPIQPGAQLAIRWYTWFDLPGEFDFFSEDMVQGFFYLYYKYAHPDKKLAYKQIMEVAKELSKPDALNRYPAFCVNHLGYQLENYATTTEGQKQATAKTLVSSMLPFAYYDLITRFDMSETALKRQFSINMIKVNNSSYAPLAFEKYWDHRAAVKTAAKPHITKGKLDMEKAAIAIRDYFRKADTILK